MRSPTLQFRNSPVERATFPRLLTSVICLLTFPFGFRVRYTFPRIRFTGGAGCRIRFGGRVSLIFDGLSRRAQPLVLVKVPSLRSRFRLFYDRFQSASTSLRSQPPVKPFFPAPPSCRP